MNPSSRNWCPPASTLFSWLFAMLCAGGCGQSDTPLADAPSDPQAVFSVVALQPHQRDWDARIVASGSVQPWQELTIDAEVGGLPVSSVDVDVGDSVHKGQVLARLGSETIVNQRAQQQAAVAEAQANLAQAQVTLAGTRGLAAAGSSSAQDLLQAQTQAKVAAARLAAAQAQWAMIGLELRGATITAPEAGVISTRMVATGTVPAVGTPLFKLIREGMVQWRAEIGARDLSRVAIGQAVQVDSPDGKIVRGTVRQISPVIDSTKLTGIVFVDLPANCGIRAGSFVSGSIATGRSLGLALPDASVVVRDRFRYAMKIGPADHVHLVKLEVGRQQDGEVEIVGGLARTDRVVAAGAALLNDGDLVKVVAAPMPVAGHSTEDGS
jgi:RND family efflux transporter MFP subunit